VPLIMLVPMGPAIATPERLVAARDAILKGRVPKRERLKLEVPELAENGNAVTITLEAQSPMTAADHVTRLHVLAEKNPLPNVISVDLSPRAGRARIGTTIRLADSQRIVALAELSNGDVLEADASVIVTIAACLDGG
jgi:sulfur-oxidizing protein SoxY